MQDVHLLFYRRDIFILRQSVARLAGECRISVIGSWCQEDDRLVLWIGERFAVFEPDPSGRGQTIRQSVGFSSIEADPELSLADIELIREAWQHA